MDGGWWKRPPPQCYNEIKKPSAYRVNLKTWCKKSRSSLGASLIGDFSGNHNNKLKFIVHSILFSKIVLWYDRTRNKRRLGKLQSSLD